MPQYQKEYGEATQNEVEMAEILNRFFASVFTIESTESIPPILPLQVDDTQTLSNIVFHDHDIKIELN